MPDPLLTETVPEHRTLHEGKAKFSYPKDPQDTAWYAVLYAESIASVRSVILTGPDTSLTSRANAVLPDKSGIALFLTGGTAFTPYRIRLGIDTEGGDTIYRALFLDVVPNGSAALVVPLPPVIIGPPLPQGTTMTASANVGGHRALMFDGQGGVLHADPSDPLYAFAGISAEATSAGNALSVIETGRIVDGAWNWTPAAELFVAAGGNLTETPPSSGVLQQVAVAINATSILVQPYVPITLL